MGGPSPQPLGESLRTEGLFLDSRSPGFVKQPRRSWTMPDPYWDCQTKVPQPPLAWDTRREEVGDVERETGIWVHRICGGKRE